MLVAVGASAPAAAEDQPAIESPNNPTLSFDAPCPGPDCTGEVQPIYAKGKRIVYLNFEGVTLQRSTTNDDAIQGVSAIVDDATETIGAFDPYDLGSTGGLTRQQIIDQVADDLYDIHADFDVEFVTERPSSGNYSMVVFGGSCYSVVGQNNCAGVALRDCGDYMPNNITFVFPPGLRVADLATTAAQEAAHAFGLGHTDDQDDVMYPQIQNYVPSGFGAGNIPDQSGCPTSATYQDSHERMMMTIGPRGQDTTGPTVAITSPAEGAAIEPGSAVVADISDESGVDRAVLQIDGDTVQTVNTAPWEFTIPADTASGDHLVTVRGYDPSDNTNFDRINVYVLGGDETPCSTDDDCDDGFECSGDLCVPDDGIGELGETCAGHEECASELCGDVGDESRCTQRCDDATPCPDGFECLTGGACWPESGGGSGAEGEDTGLCAAGDPPAGSLVGLGLLTMLCALGLRRPRRRR